MNAQYQDSVTTNSGYKNNVSIGSIEEADCSKEYAQINMAYPTSELPTNANSTKRAAPTLSANQDSPAPIGNQCC